MNIFTEKDLDQARQAVAKGAALLDERNPGWRERINLGTLEIGSVYDCVLGQLYGEMDGYDGYDVGKRLLFGREPYDDSYSSYIKVVAEHGFTTTTCDYRNGALNAAWKEFLTDDVPVVQ